MSQYFMAILKFDSEHGVGKRFYDRAFQNDCVFFRFRDWNFLLLRGACSNDHARKSAQGQRSTLAPAAQATNSARGFQAG